MFKRQSLFGHVLDLCDHVILVEGCELARFGETITVVNTTRLGFWLLVSTPSEVFEQNFWPTFLACLFCGSYSIIGSE